MIYMRCVYEDELTHQVMLKMFDCFPDCFSEYVSINCHGFGKIKRNILAYNKAAAAYNFFVITDLDTKYECAPALIADWLSCSPNQGLLFRVAVREIESWLLADKENIASFLGVSKTLIPLDSESELDPKNKIINLARRSRKRSIRNDIPPVDQYALIGPGYNAELSNFVQNHWDIATASLHSKSLDKALCALEKLKRTTLSSAPNSPDSGAACS